MTFNTELWNGAAPVAPTEPRSLRFNSADSAYLNRTPASAGNRKTWTWAGWVKRSNISGELPLLHTPGNSNDSAYFRIYISGDQLICSTFNSSGGIAIGVNTSQVFRDASAWMHIQVVLDTTQATASNRLKFYVNGVQVTQFSLSNWPTQNTDYGINTSGLIHYIGLRTDGTNYANGYLADVHFIDGQALSPTSFGEFDATTGVWNPIEYTGSYGTNGFHLDFADNRTVAGLGTDAAGSNDWTPNNFSVTAGVDNDSFYDYPTNGDTANDTGLGGEVPGNYCTWNPLDSTGMTLTNGNLDFSGSSSGIVRGTIGVNSGKWYYEITSNANVSISNVILWGISNLEGNLVHTVGDRAAYYYTDAGSNFAFQRYEGGSLVETVTMDSSLKTVSSGDVIQVAYDADTGKLWFGKNNTWADGSGGTTGNPSTGANPTLTFPDALDSMTPIREHAGTVSSGSLNCGQRPFAYQAPSGFRPLATPFLDTPTIEDGSTVMDVALYTGNGTSQNISTNFSPDFVWLKARNQAFSHQLYDIVRGAQAYMRSNGTDAETTISGVTAFNSDSFSLGSNDGANRNGDSFVAWAWDAGSSTVSNTNGSITSSVRANPGAGFSIVTWTANGSTATIGHGLGVSPGMIISKNRTSSPTDWSVYHSSLGKDQYLALNKTNAASTLSNFWGSVTPGSTTFGVLTGRDDATSGNDIVAYCFAPVESYSSFGSYQGNGSTTDNTFVYTGMRPRFVMLKRSDSTGNWVIWDAVRNSYNVANSIILPNTSAAEYSPDAKIDILSNGFKVRDNSTDSGINGATYIYAAFAENPFSIARAR